MRSGLEKRWSAEISFLAFGTFREEKVVQKI